MVGLSKTFAGSETYYLMDEKTGILTKVHGKTAKNIRYATGVARSLPHPTKMTSTFADGSTKVKKFYKRDFMYVGG